MRRTELQAEKLLDRAAKGDLAAGLELLFAQRHRLRALKRLRDSLADSGESAS